MVEDFGNGCPKFFLGNLFSFVRKMQFMCQFFCQRHFIVPALSFAESYGEGFCSGKFGSYQTGIHAAGQKRSYLHIRSHVGLHGIFNCLVQPGDPFFLLLFSIEGLRMQRGHEIWIQFQRGAFSVIGQKMSGFQLTDSLEKRFFQGGILKGQVLFQSLLIQLLFIGGMGQDSLDFRCEDKLTVSWGVVKRFDAERIPGRIQPLVLLIPDGEGEHASEMFRQVFSPLFIAVEEYFGIPLSGKSVSCCQKLPAQFLIIIDFPVKHKNQISGFVCHGLHASFQINDAEATEAQGSCLGHPAVALIRPPMDQGNHHFFQYLFPGERGFGNRDSLLNIVFYKSAYSAHNI